MSKPTVPISVISFLLVAACGALCQQRTSSHLDQKSRFDAASSTSARVAMRDSLPDAPSPMLPQEQTDEFQAFVHEVSSPLALNDSIMLESEPGRLTPGAQLGLAAFPREEMIQKESGISWGKHLYSPLFRQDSRDYLSPGGSLMSRACYAASRSFIARDDLGKTRLNTSYFLNVLSSVAAHSASRPYWARSTSETFNDLGSTIGSNAGINVFHGLEPDLRQMAKRFTPKFVYRIEERVTRGQNTGNVFHAAPR